MRDEVASVCSECGASVYRQHLESGIARYEGSRLLCSHCVADFERKQDESYTEDALETIEFEDEDKEARVDLSSSRIHGTTKTTLGVGGVWDESKFKRPLRPNEIGATRCRTFHSKLSEAAIEFMTTQINDWLDAHPDIVLKFSTSTIGNFEGKHTEPNLILTVYY